MGCLLLGLGGSSLLRGSDYSISSDPKSHSTCGFAHRSPIKCWVFGRAGFHRNLGLPAYAHPGTNMQRSKPQRSSKLWGQMLYSKKGTQNSIGIAGCWSVVRTYIGFPSGGFGPVGFWAHCSGCFKPKAATDSVPKGGPFLETPVLTGAPRTPQEATHRL